jgi:hypothetical protein
MKLRCNLRPDERRAFLTLKEKGLKVVPSDKGGDLCVVRELDYDKALNDHLVNSEIYRRVTIRKIDKIEEKVNSVWRNVCSRNKIPRRIQNMYMSTCCNFASINAVVKTHKSSNESNL